MLLDVHFDEGKVTDVFRRLWLGYSIHIDILHFLLIVTRIERLEASIIFFDNDNILELVIITIVEAVDQLSICFMAKLPEMSDELISSVD